MALFLQPDNTVDVISDATKDEYELFFGPVLADTMPLVTKSKNLGEILVELGLAPSKGWSRKNGWWKEVEKGFHKFSFGKSQIQIYVYVDPKGT